MAAKKETTADVAKRLGLKPLTDRPNGSVVAVVRGSKIGRPKG